MVAIQSEKSSAARKAFAAAVSEVAKAGGNIRVEKLSLDALKLYGGEGAEGSGKLCGALILREIARNASEQVAGYSSQLLPMVFLGRYVF